MTAMLAGAVVGGLLLKTTMVLPLVAAAALALVTWVLYIPTAPARMIDGQKAVLSARIPGNRA